MKEVAIASPAQARLRIDRGATLDGLTVTFVVKSSGAPIDWTGYTFLSQVRRDESPRSEVLATIVVTAPTPTNGILVLSSSDVGSLQEGCYRYDVLATIGSTKRYVLEGELVIEGSITRS